MSQTPKPKTTLPTHSKCPHCGHEMRMSLWVYAHWDIRVVATCEQCSKKYGVQWGVSFEIGRKRRGWRP